MFSRPVTFLELIVQTSPLIEDLFLLAQIVLKPSQVMKDYETKRLEEQRREFAEHMQVDQAAQDQRPPRTPLTPQLFDQLPFAIDMMRAKEWIFDLPTGTGLLSYLYNILTQLESDLTKVSFIRKIFMKALTPYLQMVKTYIYKGDLYDPFFEFFVKVRGETDMVRHGVSNQQEYVVDERNCLPNFLLPVEMEIYKTGVTLALLKRVERGI